MGLSTKKIVEVKITTSPRDEILEEIRKYLEKAESGKRKAERNNQKPFVIFTPNPEIITYAKRDDYFKKIVNTAQINLPDGAGVVWALRKLNGISVKQISGVDFMLELCDLANKQGFTVGLIGGKPGVALKTRECLLKKYPGLKMEVFEAPEVEIQNSILRLRSGQELKIKNYESKQAIKTPRGWHPPDGGMTPPMVEGSEEYFISLINEIKNNKIDILFVALGFPKQEYFINKLVSSWLSVHRRERSKNTTNYELLTMNPLILMAVGGSFDYISGRIPRAPQFMRSKGLEWLYRLVREPWRLLRQLKGTKFFWKVLIS